MGKAMSGELSCMQTCLVPIFMKDTVMCLSIGTPKIINFPFVPNGKLIIFRYPKIKAHYSLIMMCLNILFYSILSHNLGRSSGHHR